jgi:hypothetical protein
VIFSVFLFSLVLQFSLSEATTLNVVGVNRNPAGTPAGTSPPQPTPVGAYYWTLQEDTTVRIVPGDISTNTLSVSFHKSYMPVVASGDETNIATALANLDPAKRYFISVLPKVAGSYSNGGTSIVAQNGAFPAAVTVYVNQLPFPMAQISVYTSVDKDPINGFPDPPQESPLPNVSVYLIDAGGKYGISGGPAFTDVFGMPLGTVYALDDNKQPIDSDGDGVPNVVSEGMGFLLSDANGMATFKYLAPGKYSVITVPPDGYIQTTTIEGSRVIDAWVKQNEPPYLLEFGPPAPHIFISYAPTSFNDPAYFVNGTVGGTIIGQIVNDHVAKPPAVASYPGAPFKHTVPWIGLNDLATGKGIYIARTNEDGTFTIPKVKPGTYQLVVWDDWLDIIINFSTVIVGTSDVTVGKVPVIHWFARLEHYVFLDEDEDGIRDEGEMGIMEQIVNLRWRDGTVYQSFGTDLEGFVPFDEIFPFFNWQVAEVDFLRYKATGVTVTVDDGGPIDDTDLWSWEGQLNPQIQADGKKYRTETGPILLEGFQGFAGLTSVFQWGKKPYGTNENGGISGIVHYSVTRAEDDPLLGFGEPWEPGIPRVQVNLYPAIFVSNNGNFELAPILNLADVDNPPQGNFPGPEDIDRNENGIFDFGDAIAVTWTDSWDDNLPDGCVGPAFTLPGVTPPTNCFDGLRNWNQVRPALFDGGYAFGFAANGDPTSLLSGIYIVETVPPPGYELVKEEDKNVDFGDNYLPQPPADPITPITDPGTPAAAILFTDLLVPGGAPLCAGDRHFVPEQLSLFPGIPTAYAGQVRRLCDRKVVLLNDGENSAANFFLFTKAPIAGQFTGLNTDDITNDARPNSPNAGEKYSPPWIPISIRDWTGREIARTYSDEFGKFNGMLPSTYTANTPLPSGMTPQMITMCLNDAMKPDPANPSQFIEDTNFNKYYGQFCYTFQYMPGSTTYLDLPVLPTSAYIGATQPPLDCEYRDGTPVIYFVTGPGNNGPYVSATGQTITVQSVGSVQVLNPAYGSVAGAPKTITRDYGFGATEGTVRIGNVTIPAANVTWNSNTITAVIPADTTTGQLTIRRADNGNSTRSSVTVTVGGPAPIVVGSGQSIQAAIDAASPGDLITVPPGMYMEMVIMWKPVKLQGWGAGSTTINAVMTPVEKVQIWREKVEALYKNGDFDVLPGQQVDLTNLTLQALGAIGAGANVLLESPGVIVLAKDDTTPNGFGPGTSRIDGFNIIGSVNGGGIIVNGYAHYLEISNNRISNNMGVASGGIRVGHTDLINPDVPTEYQSAYNDNIKIHNNMITNNSDMKRGAGGVMFGPGSDSYQVTDCWICGNITLGDGGGGIGHHGVSDNGLIAYNTIIFNEAWSNQAEGKGGGIYISGLPPLAPAVLTEGSGSVTINANLILGNGAGAGDGAGIAAYRVNGLDVQADPSTPANWYTLDIFNNMIVNNVAGVAGGGIALQDVANSRIIHNTIANNDSTASARAAFTGLDPLRSVPQPAGIVSRAHSNALLAGLPAGAPVFSNPELVNNIIWHNRSFSAVQNSTTLAWSLQPAAAPYWDLAVLGAGTTDRLNPMYSILTNRAGYDVTNRQANPRFLREYFNGFQGNLPGVFDEGGNFLRVVFGPLTLMRWNASGTAATGQPWGNYHIGGLSPALGVGTRTVPGTTTLLWTMYPDLGTDFDRGPRPRPFNLFRPDIGADERPPGAAVGQILP